MIRLEVGDNTLANTVATTTGTRSGAMTDLNPSEQAMLLEAERELSNPAPTGSTSRIHPDAGWVNLAKHPKGPNGRGLCRQCGTEVSKGLRTFCGQACIDAWFIKTRPSFARKKVAERDKGICVVCGRDCEALKEKIHAWIVEPLHRTPVDYQLSHRRSRLAARCRSGGGARTLWQADHIVPVVEGGGSCGLENYRTLCVCCHKRESAALAKRLAEARRAKRTQAKLDRNRADAEQARHDQPSLDLGAPFK